MTTVDETKNTIVCEDIDVFVFAPDLICAEQVLDVFQDKTGKPFAVGQFKKLVDESYWIGTVLNAANQRLKLVIGWSSVTERGAQYTRTRDYLEKLCQRWKVKWLLVAGECTGIK